MYKRLYELAKKHGYKITESANCPPGCASLWKDDNPVLMFSPYQKLIAAIKERENIS